MESQTMPVRERYTRIQTRFSVTFAVLGIIVALITTFLAFIQSRNSLLNEFKQRAISMVTLVAQRQNSDMHSQLASPQDQNGPIYNFIKLNNQKALSADPAIGSIYTMRQDSLGNIYFVVDVVNPDLVGDRPPAQVREIYVEPGPVLAENFATLTEPTSETALYTDEWGTWISAYAPFYRSDGTQEGVLGLDIAATTFIEAQTRLITTMLIIFGGLLIPLGAAGWFIGRQIAKPILILQEGATRIIQGDTSHRVNITSGDEIEQLGQAFNEMTDRLQALITGLEMSVAKRTEELTAKTEALVESSDRLNAQATQLRAVSEVARNISSVRDTNALLPMIANIISDKFKFYHVGIFLNDTAEDYSILRASNSLGGQTMLARGHRLRIGQVGIVGYVAATGRPRIALNTGEDAIYFNNPDLPETRSEMALPLKSGQGVIGVLDVQSTESNAFKQEDVEILSTLADLVTIAIENADLFQSAHKASEEANNLLRQFSQAQWTRLVNEKEVSGYHFVAGQTTALPQPVAITAKNTEKAQAEVALIPIRIRNEIVGEIGVKMPASQKLDVDEKEIAEAIAERVALAIENARLIEDSQKRAAKERTIGEVSSRISASVDIEGVMKTAVEELGRILQGSNVTIRLEEPESGN